MNLYVDQPPTLRGARAPHGTIIRERPEEGRLQGVTWGSAFPGVPLFGVSSCLSLSLSLSFSPFFLWGEKRGEEEGVTPP